MGLGDGLYLLAAISTDRLRQKSTRAFGNAEIRIPYWPTAADRLPKSEGQLTRRSSCSTSRAWLASSVGHGGLSGADARFLDASLSHTFSELFDGPRLAGRSYFHARITEKLDPTLKERANRVPPNS
jgi:hypothetical protein